MARFGERRSAYWVLIGKPEGERDHLEALAVDRKIILKLVFKK